MSVRQDLATGTRGRSNFLPVVSVLAGVVALAAVFGFGSPVLAVFAGGSGHVAQERIRKRAERGRVLAVIGLVVGYTVGVWGLLANLSYLPALLTR